MKFPFIAYYKIKELDLYEDSIILFVADHGSMMGEHGFVEKWGHMYEQVMRIPMMIKMPKGQNGGKHLDSYVESVDFMPTLLAMLGIDIPENVQGKSHLPYMEADPEEMNNLFSHPDYKEIKDTYMKKLEQWFVSMGNIVNTNTTKATNTMSMHVIKQGENMNSVQELMAGTGRWGILSRKES